MAKATATTLQPKPKKRPDLAATNVPTQIVPAEPPDVAMPQIVANLLKEYVSGGSFSWLAQGYFRTLPQYIDDITAEFGDDLYERMLFDPQVAACVNHIKLATLAHGVRLTLPEGVKEDDPRRELAQEILEFCQRNLSGLDKPFESTLYELLDGLAFGHKVAEQIYQLRVGGVDAGKVCLRALKTKGRKSTAFVADAYMNVPALLGLMPGQGMASVVTGGLLAAPDTGGAQSAMGQQPGYMPRNILPREKFVVFSFRTKDSDPRGVSILRPAYNAWWLKMQVFPEYLKYLAVFAVASLIGYTPENAPTSLTSVDANGTVTDATEVSSEQAMLAAILQMRGNTGAVFPFGSKVDVLEAQERGEVFIMAFDFFNREITKAILNQTRATMEAEHGSRADSDTGQDVLDMVVRQAKSALAHTIRLDVIRPLVEYNYGPDAFDLAPEVSLSEMEHQDLAANGSALAALVREGYFDEESQYPKLDAMYGFPERASDWLVKRREQAQEEAQAQAEAEAARTAALAAGGQGPSPQGQGQGQGQGPKAKASPNSAKSGATTGAKDARR